MFIAAAAQPVYGKAYLGSIGLTWDWRGGIICGSMQYVEGDTQEV